MSIFHTKIMSEAANVNTPEKRKKLYLRTLVVVSIAQLFGGAGLGAGIAVGALLARDMLGTDALAGIPAALFTLGSALAAFMVGRMSQRFGRRVGLTMGFLIGGIGAAGVLCAAITDQVVLLFLSLFIYGAGTATNLQARYAGTDLAETNQRATAISVAMVSVTFGAFAGPNMVDVMGEFAVYIGIPMLSGAFILSGTAYLLASMTIFLFLRPDPYLLVKAMEQQAPSDARVPQNTTSEQNAMISRKGVATGTTIMVMTQIVMVAIMTMTPIHMEHHGHDLGDIGLVIAIHIAGMYLPSLFTGILVDKIGRTVMAIASAVTLLLAGVLAATAVMDSLGMLMTALALLGLGWNFGLISGTAMVIDSTPAATRAKTQGSVDVFIALAGASGATMSGLVVAGSSYTVLSYVGGLLALVLIPVILRPQKLDLADPSTPSDSSSDPYTGS